MLTNKVAIITGGGKGIGKGISLSFADNGADIAIIYAGDTESAKQTADEIISKNRNCKIYKCDISSFNDVKQIINQIIVDFGKVDILVNNAGITKDKLMLAMNEEDYDKVVDINLKGSFNTIRHLYTHFMRNRSGRIINVTSISGLDGNAGQTNYCSSKAGIVGLTKSVAKELASRGITCNAVAPGCIDTAMTEILKDDLKKAIIDKIPLKRMGKTEEVAALVTFLASDNASYITGQVMRIDGGLSV
jgi:3-oxoacyl-[acyl-carrier protein] reductase